MMSTLIYLITFSSLIFLSMKHPLTLGLILVVQTLLISLIIGVLSQSFWISYILFLVIIGGMLIIFMYMISLIFNKKFYQTIEILPIFTSIILSFFMANYLTNLKMNNYEMNNMDIYNFKGMALSLMKLYNFPMNLINLFLILYLLFLLIVVVKVTNFYQGPFRMKT